MYEEIASNKRKSVLLVIGAFLFLGVIGLAIGYLFGTGPLGLVIALVVAALLAAWSYFSGDKAVLASTRAQLVTPEEQPRLHNIVEGLAIAAGVPKPKVYVVPEQAPNAYATGRDPEHSSIAVTEGLLAMMNRVELEGVIAHEMSHVRRPRHPAGHHRRHPRRRRGAALGVLHAHLVVGWDRRTAWQRFERRRASA